jgi:hypothetical protein
MTDFNDSPSRDDGLFHAEDGTKEAYDNMMPAGDDEFVPAEGSNTSKTVMAVAAGTVVACCCCCAATVALYYGTEPVMQLLGIPIPWL